ncbi:ubiquinone biosynthesis protein UbiA [Rhodococcus sp. ABRD24]|uniref:UbiA family prenyltransferase n=1 Tax=Rhodococcus sp. ABRD24 TaxID=2507582 RepID=UPI00103C9CA1|nr:UbiA family prenyltransferase [Rhodococcus sp. ABRD24]QBJ98143.1 ubiquinone biosynthesis protein UbiA [Rhodococcus sp. ABRD24]
MTISIKPAHTKQADSRMNRLVRALLHEARVCWSFTWGDLSATVLPATMFAIAAWNSTDLPAQSILVVVAKCLVYFWLYIYTFNLSNQLIGIDEDRINKPHRPLVTGLITPTGARRRLMVATAAFLIVGTLFGVLVWTCLWIAAWALHNHLGWARTAWGKNAAMVAGTIAQLAAAWQIVTPLSDTAWTWILTIAIPLGALVSLQDLRDLAGDAAIGRRTAVMVMGEENSRRFFCLAFAVYPVLTYLALYRGAPTAAQYIGGAAAIISLSIAYRVIRLRDRRSDNTTYMMYTYWYCITLVSAVFAVG